MSPFQHLQHITIELHIPIEVLLLKNLDRYLVVAFVPLLVFRVLESDVALDWTAGEFDFGVSAGCEDRGEVPEGGKKRNGRKQSYEEEEDQTLIEQDSKDCWDDEEEAGEVEVREAFAAWTIGWEDASVD